MNPEFSVEIGGTTYPIVINIYGVTKVEQIAGISFFQLADAVGGGIDPERWQRASADERESLVRNQLNRFSLSRLQALLFAGLEGGRRAFRPQDPPFDWDQVGEMILEGGGYRRLAAPLMQAYAAFLPKLMGIEAPGANGDGASKNLPARNARPKSTGRKSTGTPS